MRLIDRWWFKWLWVIVAVFMAVTAFWRPESVLLLRAPLYPIWIGGYVSIWRRWRLDGRGLVCPTPFGDWTIQPGKMI